MRTVREHPRVVTARIVAAIALLVAGIAIGSALDQGDAAQVRSTQTRLQAAQRILETRQGELRVAAGRMRRTSLERNLVRRDARAMVQVNRGLRRALRVARAQRYHHPRRR